MNIDGKVFSKLTDEQKKMVEAAQTPEDLLVLAKEAGYELTQEQLDAVAGGGCAKFKEFWECTDNYWP